MLIENTYVVSMNGKTDSFAMWDQDKQQMEQESSKTSFALIRLTLDYINMRNLGITVRRITPNANQFLAWIIGSSIPEGKCMIGKGGYIYLGVNRV